MKQETAPRTGEVFALAWPLAVNAVLLHGIVIVDTLLVSALGEAALAAMGLAAAIAGLVLGALGALSHATQILVARAQGARDGAALARAFWCGLAISYGATALGLGLIAVFGRGLLERFAHTPGIAEAAWGYLAVFALVLIAEAGSQSITCHFNGTGRTRLPFYSYLVAMPVNVGLSAVLIFGAWGAPELGLIGAAIGSAVAAWVRLAFLVACLWREGSVARRADALGAAAIRAHGVFALPVATTFFGNAAANTVCALLYAGMPLNQFAAMTLILPWVQVVGTLMISWAQATGIFVGQMLGGGAGDGALDAFLARVWRVGLMLAGLVSAVYLAASVSFQWLYPALEAETLATLWSFLPVLLVFTFPKASNAMCGSTLRAGGDTVRVMQIHLAAQWAVRVPLTALFVLVMGWSATWVFALFLLDELLKFPAFHLRLRWGAWRRMMG